MNRCPKKGAKSVSRTDIHAHTRTRRNQKRKKIQKHVDVRSQTYQQCCYSYICILNFTFMINWYFFPPKCCCYFLILFFNTCQTWSHSTRLQTTESHTHVSFPQRRTNTDAARVRRVLLKNPPSLVLQRGLKANPYLSSPSWSNFLNVDFFFTFYFMIFIQ